MFGLKKGKKEKKQTDFQIFIPKFLFFYNCKPELKPRFRLNKNRKPNRLSNFHTVSSLIHIYMYTMSRTITYRYIHSVLSLCEQKI